MPRVQNNVSHGGQRKDAKVDAFEPGGRPLKIAVIDGEHDGASALGIEDPRDAVLHAPIELVAAFEKKARSLLRPVDGVAFPLSVGFGHDAPSFGSRGRSALRGASAKRMRHRLYASKTAGCAEKFRLWREVTPSEVKDFEETLKGFWTGFGMASWQCSCFVL